MSELNLQYSVGIKRQIINAFRAVYKSPNFPDQEMAEKINVLLEYPIIQERYPAIYITWNPTTPIQDMGLGNYTLERNDAGEGPFIFRQWLFEGRVGLNAMALDPVERDSIVASVMDIMAFGHETEVYKPFRDEIYDEDFVSFQLMTQTVYAQGEQTAPCPWGNRDEFVYTSSHQINAVGTFLSEPSTGNLVRISQVIPYPYTKDQPVPHGSLDGRDVNVPWETGSNVS